MLPFFIGASVQYIRQGVCVRGCVCVSVQSVLSCSELTLKSHSETKVRAFFRVPDVTNLRAKLIMWAGCDHEEELNKILQI